MTDQTKLKSKSKLITKNSEIMYPLPPEFYTCTESMKSLIPIMLNLIDQKVAELKKKLYDYLSTTTLSNDCVDDAHEQIKALNRISTEVHDAVTGWEVGCSDKEHIGVYAGYLTDCFHVLSWKYTYLEAFELDELYRNLPDYVFDESLDRYYAEPNLVRRTTMTNETPKKDNQTEEPTIITILDNGEYHDKVGHDRYIVGRSFSGITDIKKEGYYLKNWNVRTVAIDDISRAVIEDSTLKNLDVRGFCILKNCKIDRVRVSMFGNLFITEGCEINELDISGTVHTISSASKVDHTNLHSGGRIKLRTKDVQLGEPLQPKNLRLDSDREWYFIVLAITKHHSSEEAEYWAFG